MEPRGDKPSPGRPSPLRPASCIYARARQPIPCRGRAHGGAARPGVRKISCCYGNGSQRRTRAMCRVGAGGTLRVSLEAASAPAPRCARGAAGSTGTGSAAQAALRVEGGEKKKHNANQVKSKTILFLTPSRGSKGGCTGAGNRTRVWSEGGWSRPHPTSVYGHTPGNKDLHSLCSCRSSCSCCPSVVLWTSLESGTHSVPDQTDKMVPLLDYSSPADKALNRGQRGGRARPRLTGAPSRPPTGALTLRLNARMRRHAHGTNSKRKPTRRRRRAPAATVCHDISRNGGS